MAANPSSITIDEDGDLVLLVGPAEAQARIKVSSKAFTLASKVFTAILSKTFKEARDIAERFVHSSPRPFERLMESPVQASASSMSYRYPETTSKLWFLSVRSFTIVLAKYKLTLLPWLSSKDSQSLPINTPALILSALLPALGLSSTTTTLETTSL